MTFADHVLVLAGQPVVRLEGVPRQLAQRIRSRLGATVGTGDARVVVRLGPPRDIRPGATSIGGDDAGWADDGRLILHDRGVPMSVRVREESAQVEVRFGTRSADVSIVHDLANLALLDRGVVPVHAALARHGEALIACAGWSRGGKTTALVALMSRGAVGLGTEWLYLMPDGSVRTADHLLRLRSAHRADLPTLGFPASRPARIRMDAFALGARALSRGAAAPRPADRVVSRVASWLERHAYVDVPLPRSGARALVDGERLDAVALVTTWAARTKTVPIDADPFIERLAASFEEDLGAFGAAERRYRFAFGRDLAWTGGWRALYRRSLRDRLAGVPCWEVRRGLRERAGDLSRALEHVLRS